MQSFKDWWDDLPNDWKYIWIAFFIIAIIFAIFSIIPDAISPV